MRSVSPRSFMLLTLALVACNNTQGEDYYGNGPAPEVSGVTPELEYGNLGGQEVVIQGSNFGEDITEVVVQFASQNAEVLAVSDGEITVIAPAGPIEGGPVAVKVATSTGHYLSEDSRPYEYAMRFDDQDTDLYATYDDDGNLVSGEANYILVNDYWYSIYGGIGMGNRVQGADSAPTYVGTTGTDGYGEFFDFAFPRVQTTNYGWWGSADWSNQEWVVQTPAYRPFSGVADLRKHVPTFELRNRAVSDMDTSTLEFWCADLDALGSWYYGGTDEYDAVSFPSAGDGNTSDRLVYGIDVPNLDEDDFDSREDYWAEFVDACNDRGGRAYDMSQLQFCEVDEFDTFQSGDYNAEWPVGQPYFAPRGELTDDDDSAARADSCRDDFDNDGDGLVDGEDQDCYPVIELKIDVDDDGVPDRVGPLNDEGNASRLELSFPEPAIFNVTQGFGADSASTDLWPVLGLESCFDDDDDGTTELADTALRFEWLPSLVELSSGGAIVDARTHARISMTVLTLGWFGGEAQPIRASITVPDAFNVDPETGMSVVDLPAEIFYQIPNVNTSIGGCSDLGTTTTCTFGDPLSPGYGYLILTAERVTEYRLAGQSAGDIVGLNEAVADSNPYYQDVVLAYVSGDFGFFGWEHPEEAGQCGNCADDDGDGWADQLDADCVDGNAEDGSADGAGFYTCSDGLDNDGDGDIDSEDEDCETGFGRETNCGDRIDNDGDGWTDDLDGECLEPSGQEEGNDDPLWTCTDDLDNDGDGWIDGDDPECTDGAQEEVLGYSGTQCNDGIDNDGHFDPDAEDPLCITRGASHDAEEPSYTDECVDGVENENSGGEGYIDLFDPDCEYSPFWRESTNAHDPAERPGTKECYDFLDNDGDGLTDADDPGCWIVNEAMGWIAIPDGFLDDESDDDGSCNDGVDNDNDGTADNCVPGDLNNPGNKSELPLN